MLDNTPGEIEIATDAAGDPWLRKCARCGETFSSSHLDARFCPKHSRHGASPIRNLNIARTLRREKHETFFVAIDGEGITVYDDAGKAIAHHYILLGATGCDPLHNNGRPLTLEQIFHWLYFEVFKKTETKHHDAAYVMFAAGYDWAQWIKHLSEERARKLLTQEGIASRKRKNNESKKPFPVGWRVSDALEFEFDMLGENRFQLRPNYRPKHEKGVKEEPNEEPWMYICDAFAFYQTSFINVINPKAREEIGEKPYLTDGEYQLVKKGKAQRSDAVFDVQMIEYNQLENKGFSAAMSELNRAFVKIGVRLRKDQFFGPGQVAQRYLGNLKRDGIDLTSETLRQHVPQWFWQAAQDSRYGGWFEIMYSGIYHGTAWSYDLNSAYTRVMIDLPCLLHATYRRGQGSPYDATVLKGASFGGGNDRVLCLVDAWVSGSHPRIGAMLHRLDDGSGSIIRPHQTEGWHWLHEIEAAQRAGLIDGIVYNRWLAYFPCKLCRPPLASLKQLYNDRIDIGEEALKLPKAEQDKLRKTKKNSPEGVARKLTYNSIFGKQAQSVGQPIFSNPVFASLITAGCRTMILDFIASHPEGANAILMIATDGVVTTSPHPNIEIDDIKLGAWDQKTYSNLCLFKPGVYYDDSARKKVRTGDYEDIKVKARGVNMRALAQRIPAIDELFENWKAGDPWPTLDVRIDFKMISARQALAWRKWSSAGKVLIGDTIKASADPSRKRHAPNGPGWNEPHKRGKPSKRFGGVRSAPYETKFGETDEQGVDYIHPDGDLDGQIKTVFKDLSND
jgi:hypothetical protein